MFFDGFCCWSFIVFKKAGGCLSYGTYYSFTLAPTSFASYFLNIFILEKGTRKKGSFAICYVFIYVVKCILFLLGIAKLNVTFTSSVEFSSWLRLKWKWSVTISSLTPYERIRKRIYDWHSVQNAQGSNWRNVQAPWAVIIWMRKISKHRRNSPELTPENEFGV